MIPIRLLGNRVHLRPITAPERDGLIVIPETAHRNMRTHKQYLVLGTGPGRITNNGAFVPMEIKPGDFVLSNLYGEHIVLEDQTIICNADQIEAFWSNEQPT